MGYKNASDMKAAEMKGLVSEYVALHWHLTANHYPPIPTAMIPVAQDAVRLASIGEWDAEIDLPEHWQVNGSTRLTVSEIADIMHLRAFIIEEPVFEPA